MCDMMSNKQGQGHVRISHKIEDTEIEGRGKKLLNETKRLAMEHKNC